MTTFDNDQPGGFLVPEYMRLRMQFPEAWDSGYRQGIDEGRRAERQRLRDSLLSALPFVASAVIVLVLVVLAFA